MDPLIIKNQHDNFKRFGKITKIQFYLNKYYRFNVYSDFVIIQSLFIPKIYDLRLLKTLIIDVGYRNVINLDFYFILKLSAIQYLNEGTLIIIPEHYFLGIIRKLGSL